MKELPDSMGGRLHRMHRVVQFFFYGVGDRTGDEDRERGGFQGPGFGVYQEKRST